MNNYFLNHMYQAWQQGKSEDKYNYKEFVNLASEVTNTPYSEMLDFLKSCDWFKYNSDE